MSKRIEMAERLETDASGWNQTGGGEVFVEKGILRRAAALLREADRERMVADEYRKVVVTEANLANDRIAELEAALRKHGRHLPSCHKIDSPLRSVPCGCGWEEVLAALDKWEGK